MTNHQQDISLKNIINMTNGVVGLSILTMPFCFEQCGLVLGTVSLMACAIMSAYACVLLVDCSFMKRTTRLELLAFRLFGAKGKLLMELSVILLLVGNLITSQQILNEAGPAFILHMLGITDYKISPWLFSIVCSILVTLPVNLSRKLDKLTKISAFAIFFYFVFGLHLMHLSFEKMIQGPDWIENVKLWDLTGLLKCFPIFCISFSCQTVLFVIYEELCENSKKSINKLVNMAMATSFLAYFLAGFFGYIAFSNVEILGNAIGNIQNKFMSSFLNFGFIICVLSGFPFMLFPLRTSMYTLMSFPATSRMREEPAEQELNIPDASFRYITYFILALTALIAIAVPNIEFVLSLTGATTGSLTCYVWPSLLFLYARPNNSNDAKDFFVRIFFYISLGVFFLCSVTSMTEFQPSMQSDQVLGLANVVHLENLLLSESGKRNFIPIENKFEEMPLLQNSSSNLTMFL